MLIQVREKGDTMKKEISGSTLVPLYNQLANLIENKILSGSYQYGEKIPSEGEWMETYDISRVTVRNALKMLVDRGIVEKKQGKGAYVLFPVYKETISAGGSFTSAGVTSNSIPTTKILKKEYLGLSDGQKAELGFIESEIISLKRIRSIDYQPVIFEIDYVVKEMEALVDNLTESDSLIEVLKSQGYHINHFDNVIDVSIASAEVAQYLQVEEGDPLLHIKQQVLNASNKLIYFNEQFINSKLYKVAIRSY